MDLTLQGTDGADVCVLDVASLDMAYGVGGDAENDFEMTLAAGAPMLSCGQLVYAEGTEYGGMVTQVASDDGLTWRGLTWSGLLASKVLVPDGGAGALTVSGDANDVLRSLVARAGLSDVFSVPAGASGVDVGTHTFDHYEDMWTGVCDMLSGCSARPSMRWEGGGVLLSAVPAVDWSRDEEFDSDRVDVSIDLDYLPVNHLVARGEGQDGERVAVDLYMDLGGGVSTTQTLFGRYERAEYYNYTNADADTLVRDGTKRLRGYWQAASSVGVSLTDTSDRCAIGDTIGGTDSKTGVSAQATITKKVVKVDRHGRITVTYGTSDPTATSSGATSGTAAAGASYLAGRGLTLTGRTFSAEVDASDLARAEGKADAAAKAASDLEQDSVGSVSGAYPVVATADGRAVTVGVSTVPAEDVNEWFR